MVWRSYGDELARILWIRANRPGPLGNAQTNGAREPRRVQQQGTVTATRDGSGADHSFAARLSGLASGLALAVRPAGSAEVSGVNGAPQARLAQRDAKHR